jgi:hypothetical protein
VECGGQCDPDDRGVARRLLEGVTEAFRQGSSSTSQ